MRKVVDNVLLSLGGVMETPEKLLPPTAVIDAPQARAIVALGIVAPS